MATTSVQPRQSTLDLCMQVYGSIEKLLLFAQQNGLGWVVDFADTTGGTLPVGSDLSYDLLPVSDRAQAAQAYYHRNSITVATGWGLTVINPTSPPVIPSGIPIFGSPPIDNPA